MSDATPICVDLDGTLTPVDTLHEGLLELCRHSPRSLLNLPLWILKGKAYFKHRAATCGQVDTSVLPIRQDLLTWLKAERAKGHPLILATASNREVAVRIAAEIGIFDEVVASSESENLAGVHKRDALVARFGAKGFDYVGDANADVAVWSAARRAIVIGSSRLVAKANRVCQVAHTYPTSMPSIRLWLRAIRVHQWVKNALVFIPALVAHRITSPEILGRTVLAFVAFSLCASSVYIVNDLLDLSSDRRHPRKCNRPFASGALSVRSGMVMLLVLMAASASIALTISLWFCAALAAYYVLTYAYSLRLKRAALVDVMTLAGLYTLRIIAGAAATAIRPSFWLLAFSMFMFLCLGIVKRYAELHDARQTGTLKPHGRGYTGHDLNLLMTMGMASGFSAIVVIALYINSPESQALYRHVEPMWLICPLLLYWISRVWLLAARGEMNDDPVVFAVKDRISLATLGLIGLFVFFSV
jgi:4-hydroxybenzoate polyprenyltransferase/phosphoserine phosphatase